MVKLIVCLIMLVAGLIVFWRGCSRDDNATMFLGTLTVAMGGIIDQFM